MLSSLNVRNFQSLKTVDLELGKLTVIIGPSSSGKSALMRALRVLASNSRGSSFVTNNEKTASVQANGPDWFVRLERGESNAYVINQGGKEDKYTKLGGAVPEEVTSLLGIDPATSEGSLYFAGQWDHPYLLDASGTQVARTLGELTNVNIIFEASREANRRRLAANSTLKTRKFDLDFLTQQAKTFKSLPARIKALESAEQELIEINEISRKITDLTNVVESVETAEIALANLGVKADVVIPDYSPIAETQNRIVVFKQLFAEMKLHSNSATVAKAELVNAVAKETALEQQRHKILHDAGTCPTCGQSTKELVSAV